MRILYITECWTGLKDIIYNGKEIANGMPAFIKPLQELCDRGHIIDLFVIDSCTEYAIKMHPKWEKRIKVVRVFKYHHNALLRFYDMHAIKKAINELITNNSYDFIYGHGSAAGIAHNQIMKKGIPYGHRIYGTFLYDEIKKNGVLRTKIRRHNECSVFTKKKDFLLVTDDGTKGREVFELLNAGKTPFRFEFWLNGVDCLVEKNAIMDTENVNSNIDDEIPTLFYLARISRWKGQHKAIELVKEIRDIGCEVKLIISGQVIEEDYYNELKELVEKYKLGNNVFFTGAVDKKTAKNYCSESIASLAFYDFSNRGNVFYEYLSYGAIVISLNDGSLDEFIQSGENGFLINELNEGKWIIKQLIEKEYNTDLIRQKAKETYKEKMMSWEERIEKEIDLINSVVKK